MTEDKKKSRILAGKAAKAAKQEEPRPEPEVKQPAPVASTEPMMEAPLTGVPSISVQLPNGSEPRVYTAATHGPNFATLARNYKVGQNGKYV